MSADKYPSIFSRQMEAIVYRSVLPLVSKIFEKIIYRQLYDYLQDNSLLNTYQSGFRSMHSTLTALLETTNNWSINIDNGLLNGVLFIDLKKAFDTIDHEITLRKLANYGVDQSALRFFASYLRAEIRKYRESSDRSEKTFFFFFSPKEPIWLTIFGNDIKRFDFLFLYSKVAKPENLDCKTVVFGFSEGAKRRKRDPRVSQRDNLPL